MQIDVKNCKHRTRVRHFVTGKTIEAKWTIEILIRRKWVPVGTDDGLSKFDTKEAAEAAIAKDKAA